MHYPKQLAFLVFILVGVNATVTQYNIAIVAPISGEYVRNATRFRYGTLVVQSAIQAVNQQMLTPLGAQLAAQFYDTQGDARSITMQQAIAAANTSPYFIVGGFYSGPTSEYLPLTTSLQIPQMGWYCTSSAFSDKSQYPYFSRIVPSDAFQGKALAQLIWNLGARRAAIVAENTVYGTSITQFFIQECERLGIDVLFSEYLFTGSTPTIVRQQVINPIVQFDVHYIVLASASTNVAQLVVAGAMEAGLDDDKHIFLGSDGTDAWAAYPVGSLTTSPYQNVSAWFTSLLHHNPNVYNDIDEGGGVAIRTYSALYDVVFAIGYALSWLQRLTQSCMSASPNLQMLRSLYSTVCWRNTSDTCQQWAAACVDNSTAVGFCASLSSEQNQRLMLSGLVRLVRFHGASGWVQLDENGDGSPLYFINNQLAPITYSYIYSTSTDPTLQTVGTLDPTNGQVVLDQPLLFPGYSDTPPPDRRGTVIGQTVANVPDVAILILAFGLMVIGGEAALILFDQAIFVRLYKKPERLVSGWTLLTALALTVGLWSSDLALLSSIRMPDLPDADNTISYATSTFAFFQFPLLLTFLALRIALQPIERNLVVYSHSGSASDSGSTATATGNRNPITAKSTIAIYGKSRACFRWDKNHGKIYTLGAAVFLVSAMVLHHELVFSQAVIAPCSTQTRPSYVIGGVLVACILGSLAIAMYTYFRTTQLRFLSAIVMASAVWTYQFMSMTAIQYTYTAQRPTISNGQSASVVALVVSVVCVVLCVVLLGFNTSTLTISRDAFNTLAAKKQQTIEQQAKAITALRAQIIRDQANHAFELERIQLRSDPRLMNMKFEQHMKALQVPNALAAASATGSLVDITLKDVIQSPTAIELFRIGTLLGHSDENVGFVKAVDFYSSAPKDARPAIAQEIMKQYVLEDSKTPINLSGSVREEVMNRTEAKTYRADVFDPARNQILSQELGTDVWTRFVKDKAKYDAARAVIAADRQREAVLKIMQQQVQETPAQDVNSSEEGSVQLTLVQVKSRYSRDTASEPQSPPPIVSLPGVIEDV